MLLVENGEPSGKGRAVLRGQGKEHECPSGGRISLDAAQTDHPLRAGFFYDPEPGEGGRDLFWFSPWGAGSALDKFIFDVAYMFRTGTVQSTGMDTTVYQHTCLGR